MQDTLQQLKTLAAISKQLEPTPNQRSEYSQHVQKYADHFLNNFSQRKAYDTQLADASKLTISGTPKSMEDLLTLYHQEVATTGISAASPGHLGYIPGGSLYASALGDFLADITNEYAGMFYASPGGVAIEDEVLNWMKSIFGFPKDAIGNLTSGGSIANLIALTAARDKCGISGKQIEKSVVYLSEQTHHCIHKALRIIGLADVQLRNIPMDEGFRIQPKALEKQLEADKKAGLQPFLVIASAGTTDTGAIDPLKTIGEISKKHGVWYHIDAAYGGFFILTESKKHLFEGIEQADSLVVDPHKSLFLPFGIGAVLVKDQQAVYQSNHYRANYMQDAFRDDFLVNPADISPELSKHFRGLRIWLPLQLHGLAPFVACLEEKLLLTAYFRQRLIEHGFQVGPTPDLSVSYFWYPVETEDENVFNQQLLQAIHQDGRVFLSSTTIQGRFVIRIAILAFRTKLETIDLAMEMILEALEKAKRS